MTTEVATGWLLIMYGSIHGLLEADSGWCDKLACLFVIGMHAWRLGFW